LFHGADSGIPARYLFCNQSGKIYRTMKKQLFYLFLLALVITSCDNAPKDSKEAAKDANEEKMSNKMEDDASFAVEAADGGMLEVQAGQLALTKSSSAVIKETAQKMIDDHTMANDELKALAATKNITLPGALSEKNQKKYNDLNEKSGADFDEAYAEMLVSEHKEAIDDFKEAADDAKDADLKAWAAGKVSALEHHLEMAKAAKDKH
jgi:putative membrane protein